MSKNLRFLISFVLVLSLGGFAQAGTPIDVNNYSFEYDCNGVEVTCHTGHITTPGEQCDGSIAAWRYLGSGYTGIDVNCGWEDEECGNCHDWIEYPDGTANLFFQGDASVHQILDHNIVYGHKYTMTVDLMAWDPIVLEFFSPNDVCTPDVNHFLLSSTAITPDVWYNTDMSPTRWMYEYDVEAICVITDVAMDGRKLGIKIGGEYLIGGTDTSYLWADNVRVEYEWASNAYDPAPSDGAEDVNYLGVTLSWSPGLWAVSDVNGHDVYFGTSWAEVNDATTATTGIYRGSGVGVVSGPDGNDRYSYVIPGGDLPLTLGQTYFWRIDEVNENYVGPVPQPWKGDVWSFEVEGKAKAVYPADGAADIPALNLLLRWEAGTNAGSHDVYFGSNPADVEDANTANTSLYPNIFQGNQLDVNDPNYPVPEDLEVGKPYFWRIDEVNTATVKGDVWSFTTGVFLIVDSFEWYQTHQEIKAVWKDYWTGTIPKNQAEIFVESADANKFLGTGEQSMRFYYRNSTATGPDPDGSTAEADTADLEIGSDWTIGGVKALVVNFCGDTANGQEDHASYSLANDRLWMSLLDGDSDEGIVRYPDMSDVADGAWHEWNISLLDPCFSDVDMNNVAKVYIGFGGVKGDSPSKYGAGCVDFNGDTVWFDDISLYPPRCLPTVTGLDNIHALGDITGSDDTEDCNTDYYDLELMAEDWASIDGLAITENRPAVLTGFPDTTSHWVTGFDGNNAIDVNEGYNIDIDDPRLFGLTSMSITVWVSQTVANSWVGVLSSREEIPGCGDDATEIGIYGKKYGGPDGLGYDWSCGEEDWQFDAGLDVPEDGTWTFIALSVDPTGATLYMKPDGSSMSSKRNEEVHPVQQNFNDHFTIGSDDKEERGYFVGKIDDVRIYGYNLDDANMELLAGGGEPNPPPAYWYKFDETSGYSAADYGTPIEVYTMNMSLANLMPKDPCESEDPNLGSNYFDPNNLDIVNFRDYRMMAEHWLEGPYLWPPQP